MLTEVSSFFSENFFLPVYLFTLILSITTYRKFFDTQLKFFPILIAYTFFNELLGVLVRRYSDFSFFKDIKHSYVNDVIYNIYSLVFFGFFYWLYYQLIHQSNPKKWVIRLSIIVGLTYLISCLFQNPLETNLFYAHALGSWALLFFVFVYLKNLQPKLTFQRDKYNLMFWVSIGLICFYSLFPFLFLIGYLRLDIWEKYYFRTILHFLIVVMYALFCIGFIISRRRAFR